MKFSTILASILVPFLTLFIIFLDLEHLGPYTTWYNEKLENKAQKANLVGRPIDDVKLVLGEPDHIVRFWSYVEIPGIEELRSASFATLEYYPSPFLPFSKFQVHTTGGIVHSLEKFDD